MSYQCNFVGWLIIFDKIEGLGQKDVKVQILIMFDKIKGFGQKDTKVHSDLSQGLDAGIQSNFMGPIS